MGRDNKIILASAAEKREEYEAPVIEAVEVRAEQGFQQSLSSPSSSREEDEYTW